MNMKLRRKLMLLLFGYGFWPNINTWGNDVIFLKKHFDISKVFKMENCIIKSIEHDFGNPKVKLQIVVNLLV